MAETRFYESDEGTPSPEIAVMIIVPEEFVGFACAELAARQGMITGMDAPGGTITIRASLPASEFDSLHKVIISDVPYGRLERDTQPPPR
jgi:hypothetical protein